MCLVMNIYEDSSSKSGLEGGCKQGDSYDTWDSSNITTRTWNTMMVGRIKMKQSLWEIFWEISWEKKSTNSDNWSGESKDQDT